MGPNVWDNSRRTVGVYEGKYVGELVGASAGDALGDNSSPAVGVYVGELVGESAGDSLGVEVFGAGVGCVVIGY